MPIKPKSSVAALLVSLFGVCLGAILIVEAQQCRNGTLSNELRNRAAGADGKIHVTYSFNDPNISSQARAAIQNAISQWNSQSNSTRVVFEQAQPGQFGDLDFTPSDNTDNTGGCAGYNPDTARVYYSPAWQQRAQTSASSGATVIAHEIGHYLGLDEAGINPSQPTIMNNLAPSASCQSGTVPTTTVQPNDATKAGSCISQVRPTPTPPPAPSEFMSSPTLGIRRDPRSLPVCLHLSIQRR